MIQSKISVLTSIICRLRDYINSDCWRQIYLTLVHPYLWYCIAVWGGTYKTCVDSLFITQNNLMSIITFRKHFDHTNDILRDLRLQKLPDILYLQTILFVHNSVLSFPANPPWLHPNTRQPWHQTTQQPACSVMHYSTRPTKCSV